MRKNSEEKKVRKLFHELRREDERLTPSFTRDWGAASSQFQKARIPRPLLQIATVVVMLILLVGYVFSSLSTKDSQSAIPFAHVAWGIASIESVQLHQTYLDQQDVVPNFYYSRRTP